MQLTWYHSAFVFTAVLQSQNNTELSALPVMTISIKELKGPDDLYENGVSLNAKVVVTSGVGYFSH